MAPLVQHYMYTYRPWSRSCLFELQSNSVVGIDHWDTHFHCMSGDSINFTNKIAPKFRSVMKLPTALKSATNGPTSTNKNYQATIEKCIRFGEERKKCLTFVKKVWVMESIPSVLTFCVIFTKSQSLHAFWTEVSSLQQHFKQKKSFFFVQILLYCYLKKQKMA